MCRPIMADWHATHNRVHTAASWATDGQTNFVVNSFRVVFTRAGDTRPVVPEEAIVWGGEGSHLFVVRDGKAVRVPVTITARREGAVFVDGGLRRTDRVIVEGVQKVRDGQDIRLVSGRATGGQDVQVRQSGTDASTSRPTAAAADGE